jgi:hypothetical protein
MEGGRREDEEMTRVNMSSVGRKTRQEQVSCAGGDWWGGGGGGCRAGGEDAGMGFGEGLEVVAGAVSGVAPAVGDFVRMVAARKWVEGRAGDKKAPGAYCTQFPKSRTPRVYMSAYSGRWGRCTQREVVVALSERERGRGGERERETVFGGIQRERESEEVS